MSNKISVVIPTHRRADLLSRAVSSVLNQTYQPVEILVVDDADDMDTRSLVSGLNNPIVKYIFNNQGKGASSSRNLGIKLATGDYVAFLDDDDEWLKNKLELQDRVISQSSAKAVFCRIRIVYEDTKLTYETRASMPKDPYKSILIENFIGATISACVSREILLELQGFDERFPAREEYDLWIRILQKTNLIYIIAESLAISYRSMSKRSRISQSISNYERAINLLNEKYSEEVKIQLSKYELNVRKSRQFEFLAAQAASINLKKKTVHYYSKSFFTQFSLKTFIQLILSIISTKLLVKIRSFI